MKKQLLLALLIAVFFLPLTSVGQVDSTSQMKYRKIMVYGTGATIYATTMIGLDHLWYKDYPRDRFHFHNDNASWQGIDKYGHALTAYYISNIGYRSFKWAGYNDTQAAILGSASGFLFQTIIEILDGFSAQWGASPGDIIANTAGSALFLSQHLLWSEQRLSLKISCHPTPFPQYRPDLLGKNALTNLLKDYNGQTHWISANIKSFCSPSTPIPSWLNIAIGYNAYGMTGAEVNSRSYRGIPIPEFERTKRFFIAPDIDLTRIDTGVSWINNILTHCNLIKLPTPALSYDMKKGWNVFLLYF